MCQLTNLHHMGITLARQFFIYGNQVVNFFFKITFDIFFSFDYFIIKLKTRFTFPQLKIIDSYCIKTMLY